MRLSRSIFALLSIATLAALSACGSSDGGETTLHIMSEEFYPYNYRENGDWKGLSYEVVQEILARSGRTETVELRDWSSALQALETEENAVLFTTTLTPERKQKFKWAGPLGRIDWVLYAGQDRIPPMRSLEEARPYRIAVVQDYPMQEILVEAALPNLIVFPTIGEALSALFEGRVDLAASDVGSAEFYAESAGLDRSALSMVYELKTELLYIAFSKGVSDALVSRWQKTLDDMKSDGSFAAIYRKYLPHSSPPGRLQLFTEQYPPITFRDAQGRITGGATEMVRAIAAQLGVPDEISLTNWDNAYSLALDNPRVVLFSTERTAPREDLFNWVGPIGRNSADFYTRRGSGVIVESIEDARRLRAIGTSSAWFTEQMLQDLGFTNLVSVADPSRLPAMLMNGEIDTAVFTDITMNDIVSAAGFRTDDFTRQYRLSSTDFYIALSKGTDPEIVSAWQTALDRMVADGTFAALYAAWYPGAENPYEAGNGWQE